MAMIDNVGTVNGVSAAAVDIVRGEVTRQAWRWFRLNAHTLTLGFRDAQILFVRLFGDEV